MGHVELGMASLRRGLKHGSFLPLAEQCAFARRYAKLRAEFEPMRRSCTVAQTIGQSARMLLRRFVVLLPARDSNL